MWSGYSYLHVYIFGDLKLTISPYRSGLVCKCPACGQGSIYQGVLTVREACDHCQLPLKKHDAGDGPAFFAITIVGALAAVVAWFIEIMFMPPMWVHLLVMPILIVVSSIVVLRIGKAILIGLQYRHCQYGFEDKHDGS